MSLLETVSKSALLMSMVAVVTLPIQAWSQETRQETAQAQAANDEVPFDEVIATGTIRTGTPVAQNVFFSPADVDFINLTSPAQNLAQPLQMVMV